VPPRGAKAETAARQQQRREVAAIAAAMIVAVAGGASGDRGNKGCGDGSLSNDCSGGDNGCPTRDRLNDKDYGAKKNFREGSALVYSGLD
jgi:hypothetical protein